MDLSLSGLASGFDWKTLVDQLVDVQRAPERQLQSEQYGLQQRQNAYNSLTTQLGVLKNRVDVLKDPALFGSRTASSSLATLATATSAGDTPTGTYSFSVSQFASAALLKGTVNAGRALSATSDVSGVVLSEAGFSTAITAGQFTVDGKQVTIATTDTLQDVFDKISTATSGAVTGSYDPATDKISLTKASGELILGSANDTSNFLQATRLYNSGGTTTTSTLALGTVKMDATLDTANLATEISGTAGEFKVNGVSITWANTDKVSDVLARINSSDAGVTATYDATADRFTLTNKSAGDVGIAVEEVTGNFLTATGLAGATLQHGTDLLYTVNGGDTLRSHSNTISEDTSGIKGLSVSVIDTTGTTPQTFSISVAADTAKIKTAIKDFLTEYNKVQSMIDSQTASSTDSKGKVTTGVLANENDATEIASSLRRITFGQVAGLAETLNGLADMGIDSNGNDNSLTLSDESALDTALAQNPNQVQDLFTDSSNGLGAQLADFLDKTVGDDGSLVTHTTSIGKQITAIDTQIADYERFVLSEKSRLTDSFVTMETAQQNINAQLKYLQQQFP